MTTSPVFTPEKSLEPSAAASMNCTSISFRRWFTPAGEAGREAQGSGLEAEQGGGSAAIAGASTHPLYPANPAPTHPPGLWMISLVMCRRLPG